MRWPLPRPGREPSQPVPAQASPAPRPRREWAAAPPMPLASAPIPLAATLLLFVFALGKDRLSREARIFVLSSLAAAFWLVLLAAAYSTQPRPTPHLFDRYVFYLAPLALIAMFLWIRLGLPRSRAALAIAVCVFLLPAAVPYGDQQL